MNENSRHLTLEDAVNHPTPLLEVLNNVSRRYHEQLQALGGMASNLMEAEARLALFDSLVHFRDELPEEVPFRVDFGKAGGSDLIFHTREVQVYMRTPWQSHNVLLGLHGEEWLRYTGPIVEAVERELREERAIT